MLSALGKAGQIPWMFSLCGRLLSATCSRHVLVDHCQMGAVLPEELGASPCTQLPGEPRTPPCCCCLHLLLARVTTGSWPSSSLRKPLDGHQDALPAGVAPCWYPPDAPDSFNVCKEEQAPKVPEHRSFVLDQRDVYNLC